MDAKVKSLQVRPFVSSDLAFGREGLIDERHGARARLGKTVPGVVLSSHLYQFLLQPAGDSLQGDRRYIETAFQDHFLFRLRNEHQAAALKAALHRRDIFYLEKYKAGPLNLLAAEWQKRIGDKLQHLLELAKAIELRHAKLEALYQAWEVPLFDADGNAAGRAKAGDIAHRPETHSDYVANSRIVRQGEFPWESDRTETVKSIFSTSRNLPVGSMHIGSNTSINAKTTGAEGEEERKHRHITGPSFNVPTSGFTQAMLAALSSLPLKLDADGNVEPSVLPALVGVISNLRRFISQESETYYPTQRTLRFNEDARHPWAEELARYHRELAQLEEEITQQTTFNRRLPHLESIWRQQLEEMEQDVKVAMLNFADTFLVSPVPGRLVGIFKDAGEHVQPGEAVARVESTDSFLLAGLVNHHALIKVGDGIELEVRNVFEGGNSTSVHLAGIVVSVRGHDENDDWDVIIEVTTPDLGAKLPLNYTFDRGNPRDPDVIMKVTST